MSLSQINDTTGAASPLVRINGGIGVAVEDLAGDPTFQGTTLWGVRARAGTHYLAAWNPFLQTFLSEVPISGASNIATLAIDPTSGEFFGIGDSKLYKLTPASGVATLVGASAPIGTGLGTGLGFNSDGALYGVGSGNVLFSINKFTGAPVQVGVLSGTSRIEDIAFRPADGAMIGIGYSGRYELYRIDLATAQTTVLGPSLGRPSGLAYTAAPEPSTIILGLLAGLVARIKKPR